MATFGTWSSGQVLTAADLNTVLPSCVLVATGVSIATGTGTFISYSSEEYDPLGWHNNVTNNSRITPTIAGWYLCTATVQNINPTGGNYRMNTFVMRNRASATFLDNWFAKFDVNNYAPDDVTICGVTYLNGSTDYIEHSVLQLSGTTQTVASQFTSTLIAR